MQKHQKYDWQHMLQDLKEPSQARKSENLPKWHHSNLLKLQTERKTAQPEDIIHAVIVATWNESREVLEPTIESILASHYDMKKVIFLLAYEKRGGPEVETQAKQLVSDYVGKFMHAEAVKHTDLPNEVIGKGGNITAAGRRLKEYLEEQKIDPKKVIVTTLDSDNRPHPSYLAAVSYTFLLSPDPFKVSYQPIPIFTNNIWDAPAPMRVIATGNSFWMIVQALRPHSLRNFSSHAQPMQALIDSDFWSTRTIVEDGHQFWRTYFRYDGHHEVYPIFLPIGQDAVLSETYRKTLRAQFKQLQRWAWGASDIAYVAEKGFFSKNKKLHKIDVTFKFLRLLEGHVSWATAPLILLFAAFIPALFNPQDYTANQLPLIASRIQTIALGGIFITLFLSFKALPPKPTRYKKHRTLWMLVQWVMLPVTGICYNAAAALNSQTRLIFKLYLNKFALTEKAVKTDDKGVITGHGND
jgi:cellulose synthase/poly-beta-1,6-N-acetylglucosamine synthase-like glycosyltransferase